MNEIYKLNNKIISIKSKMDSAKQIYVQNYTEYNDQIFEEKKIIDQNEEFIKNYNQVNNIVDKYLDE